MTPMTETAVPPLAPRPPLAGEPAPAFTQRAPGNPRYVFDSAAGRYLVLCFLHSAGHPVAQGALRAVLARPDLFDDRFAAFFAVSTDPADEAEGRIANRIPGYRVIWDMDLSASRRYGAVNAEGARLGVWVVIDPTMRVIDTIPFRGDGTDAQAALDVLAAQPPPDRFAGFPLQAPILYLPRVFEPALCERLIALYDAQGGELSGFMRQVDGRTVGVHDPNHKVRRDVLVEDQTLIAVLRDRILRRVVPEIAKVHQFKVTRMERYLVACYDGQEGGHFAAHRDNTTTGTAHRRFAVSVNLNDGFEGGEVSFPEYGPRGFKAQAGGAVVFSCSLLHAVSRVTAGRRYAFLPFLYDDAAARIREANLATLAPAQG
jgi:predicted 2-oxoglutarate/Fe(II)-dependent dioxygenase YbiX/peroxiredoxin